MVVVIGEGLEGGGKGEKGRAVMREDGAK